MSSRKKLVIISSGYPFGSRETFLHNEVLFLSAHFDIEIFPIIKKNADDKVIVLPLNVSYNTPVLVKKYFPRLLRGLFNRSPLLPYIKDLFRLLKNPAFFKEKFSQWVLSLLVFRTFYSSPQFKKIKAAGNGLVYFYWATMPVGLIGNTGMKIFIRVHGGEVDLERNDGYIPVLHQKIVKASSIHYLPISQRAAMHLDLVNKVNFTVNRLGVFDNGLNPAPVPGKPIRVVSCSNLIKLKRVSPGR